MLQVDVKGVAAPVALCIIHFRQVSMREPPHVSTVYVHTGKFDNGPEEASYERATTD